METNQIKCDIENQTNYTTNDTTNDTTNEKQIKYNQNKINQYSEPLCMELCQSFILFVFIICLFGGVITWNIFAIIALSNNSIEDIKDVCPNSNLWVLLIILVIQSIISILSNNKENKENKDNNNMFKFIFAIAMSIWSGIELFSKCPYDKLSDTNIYLLVSIHFWISIAIISLVTIISCCYMYIDIKS